MLEHIISGIGFGRKKENISPVGSPSSSINVKVVGVGGAGGNAVSRMVRGGLTQVEALALNTDFQALAGLKSVPSYAIGPQTVNGMGSGGRPEVGRRAIKESQKHVAELLDGADMVFITAGNGRWHGHGRIVDSRRHCAKEGRADRSAWLRCRSRSRVRGGAPLPNRGCTA